MSRRVRFRFLVLSLSLSMCAACASVWADARQPVVPVEHQQCARDKDCEIAMLKCSCDCGTPVNKVYLEKYSKERAARCKNYHGAVCKILCPQALGCVKGVCAFTEKGPEISKKSRK